MVLLYNSNRFPATITWEKAISEPMDCRWVWRTAGGETLRVQSHRTVRQRLCNCRTNGWKPGCTQGVAMNAMN